MGAGPTEGGESGRPGTHLSEPVAANSHPTTVDRSVPLLLRPDL